VTPGGTRELAALRGVGSSPGARWDRVSVPRLAPGPVRDPGPRSASGGWAHPCKPGEHLESADPPLLAAPAEWPSLETGRGSQETVPCGDPPPRRRVCPMAQAPTMATRGRATGSRGWSAAGPPAASIDDLTTPGRRRVLLCALLCVAGLRMVGGPAAPRGVASRSARRAGPVPDWRPAGPVCVICRQLRSLGTAS
jgi:hypothetical protein